ncbi:MAG: hypothetical protein R3348_08870 [Xanthomonadales bacterium]|nr:hypothetical protein [Xanthomonadales bacterium]
MGKFAKRFTKEEFKKELTEHLSAMPKGHFRSPAKIEEHAEWKAEYYERALKALDDAKEKLANIADSHPDAGAKEDAKAAMKRIDDAVNAYGDASLNQNSEWDGPWQVDNE